MNTEIIKIQPGDGPVSEEDDAKLKAAGEILRRGGLVAFPTETVYGLGGDALNPTSSKRIYAAKGRPSDNPLIVHIYRFEDIYKITGDVPEEARRIADAFWPGPLTMILPKSDAVPYETTGGLDTVAIRMPSHPAAQKLIEYSGGYIAAPSANTSGKPSPTVAKYVVEELSAVLGTVDTDATILRADSGQAPKAPGMKYRHYAPRGELTIVEGTPEQVREYINREAAADHAAGEKTGIIGTEEMLSGYTADVVKSVGSRRDEDSIARHLYTILREFDDEGVTKIYSEGFSTDGFGQAIMNRLLKAAGHKVVKL